MKNYGDDNIQSGGQIINADIEHGTADPDPSHIGRIFYRTDLSAMRVSDGTTWSSLASSGITPANPTASLALAAVNGSATTYMRSDAAPALSQAITPTWTGEHNYTAVLGNWVTTNGLNLGAGSAGGKIRWVSAGAATNSKVWEGVTNTTSWIVRLTQDDGTNAKSALVFTRSTTALTAQDYGNSTDYPAHTFYGNTVINPPATGVTLTLGSTSGNYWLNGTDGTSSFSAYSSSGVHMGTSSNHSLSFFTSGYTNERMIIDSAGAVSINTPSTGFALSITGLNDNQLSLNVGSGQQYTSMYWRNNGTIKAQAYWDNTNTRFTVGASTSGGGSLRLTTSNGAAVDIAAAGNVTVNAPSSGTAFDVTGVSGARTAYFRSAASSDGLVAFNAEGVREWMLKVTNSNGAFALRDNSASADRILVSTAGNVTINTPSSGNTLTINQGATDKGIHISNGSGSMYLQASGGNSIVGTDGAWGLDLYTNTTQRLTISSSGNVTINTPSSGDALSVSGNITANAGTPVIKANGTSSSPRFQIDNTGVRKAYFVLALSTNDFVNGLVANDAALCTAGGKLGFSVNDGGGLAGYISSTGNWVVNPPSSGVGFVASAASGDYAGRFIGNSSSGNSYGLNVWGGTTSADYGLSVANQGNSSTYFRVWGDGGVAVGNGVTSGGAGDIRASANITAYYSSDSRLKENVKAIPDALAKVEAIRGVTFDWTPEYIKSHGGEDNYFMRKHDVGVIAQEIEAVLPEVVATQESGYKAVKYDRVVALLIEAVKELSTKVNDLERQLKGSQ